MDKVSESAYWPANSEGCRWFRFASLKVALASTSLLTLMLLDARAANDSLTLRTNGSPYRISALDCHKQGVKRLLVDGSVELVHPDDSNSLALPPEIFIHCSEVLFENGSKLFTRAALYVHADISIGGAVNIENTRGVRGANAWADPSVYAPSRAEDGKPGAQGLSGRKAGIPALQNKFRGTPAEAGRSGGSGERGNDGRVGSPGAPGGLGFSGAPITLKAATYLPGSTLTLTSRGGDGGAGADGGRGQDGGHGGIGGIGGAGGDASPYSPAAPDGRGGAGGDGGNGGWGGAGGDGGNGGRGGDANVLILADDKGHHGNPPADWTYHLEGGKGGFPGAGGAPGRGGKGAPGGFGGCGGSGSGNNQLIFPYPSGSCGAQGPNGKDGGTGALGRFGRDGGSGNPGALQLGYVKEAKSQ